MTQYFAKDPTEIRLSVSAIVWRGNATSGELLLMRRSDNGLWGLPGGYVEMGESVHAAIEREVREETGTQIRVGSLIGVYSDPTCQVIDYGNGRRVQAVNLCFEAEAISDGEPTTPQETLEQGYFRVEDLPTPFVPIHRIRIDDARSAQAAARVR